MPAIAARLGADAADRPAAPAASVHLTDISLANVPVERRGLRYRCAIRSRDEAGRVRFEHVTRPRAQPQWLVDFDHAAPAGDIVCEFQARPTGSDGPWQAIGGEVVIDPRVALAGEVSALLERPVGPWEEAPELRMQARLSAVRHGRAAGAVPAGSAGRRRPGAGRAVVAAAGGMATGHAEPVAVVLERLRAVPALTPQEEVVVKDMWNKLLAFDTLLAEMFFERLLHDEPDLVERFGLGIDNVMEEFRGLFDLAVRGLDPRTEHVLRESYKAVHPSSERQCNTLGEYAELFAALGMESRHWAAARRVFVWMLPRVPYLEEYERENIAAGPESAPWRFFSRHVMLPMLEAVEAYDRALSPGTVAEMRRSAALLERQAREAGTFFYRTLFERHPEIVPLFGRTDVDALAKHLMQAIAFITRALEAGQNVGAELSHLANVHAQHLIPPDAYPKLLGPLMATLERFGAEPSPEVGLGWRVLLDRIVRVLVQPMITQDRLLGRAREFLELIAREQAWEPADLERRWAEVEREVRATGTYTQTYEELSYGAQVAWRNAPKCIGRIAWKNMVVRDLRHVTDPDEMFAACAEHLRLGTNGGNVQVVMSVFRPKRPRERWGPRVWNAQLIRYAAYELPDGGIVGDAANLALTKAITRLGWRPPEPAGEYDVLPLVIEVPGHAPRIYEVAREDVLEVGIEHPTVPGFAALGLRWCVVPAIANFRLEAGGIDYACAPFNGWFMGTEIARNLFEAGRYGKAEAIAEVLGLDTTSEQTLWRDKAFLELNVAVLHSFAERKVTIVDHQTASRQFLAHDLREKRAGRECPAQWSWVVPAAGGSTTPVWHHEMRDFLLRPHYFHAADKWAVLDGETGSDGDFAEGGEEPPPIDRVLVLYASETGTAEAYARQAGRRLRRFRPRVVAMDEYDASGLRDERLVLVVTSTFGDGEMPRGGRGFLAWLQAQPRAALDGLRFAVMAIGSTVYPRFCAAGAAVDRELARAGGTRLVALARGDEIRGQADTFRQWLDLVAALLGEDETAAGASGEEAGSLAVRFVEPPEDAAVPGPGPGRAPLARVLANRELLKEVVPGARSTRHLAFDLAGTGLGYEAGDHVAVHPRNPRTLVERLCRRLDVEPGAWFRTVLVDREGRPAPGETAYPDPYPVARLLGEDLDLGLPDPIDELVAAMLAATPDQDERDELEHWLETLRPGGADQGCARLRKWIGDVYLDVAELLEAFPSCRPDLARLVELLPRQRPRFYSVSSSALVHPGVIQATVGVVQGRTDQGRVRQGLCSTYLAGLRPGDAVRLSVRPTSFKLPGDSTAPLLMVGPGTGLSPLIGFGQERAARLAAGEPLGPALLYFGCRDRNDLLYEDDLASWRRSGVLSGLSVAFSRATPGRKVYVQDLIEAEAAQVWAVLRDPRSRFYVCGDSRMADDVVDRLLLVAQREGGLSYAEAVDVFDRMRAEGRFAADVWGVTLRVDEALPEVRRAKYNRGEAWLQRVQAADGQAALLAVGAAA